MCGQESSRLSHKSQKQVYPKDSDQTCDKSIHAKHEITQYYTYSKEVNTIVSLYILYIISHVWSFPFPVRSDNTTMFTFLYVRTQKTWAM